METKLNNTASVLGEYNVVPTFINFEVLVVSLISGVTPATSDSSTKIATTAYMNNKLQVVSALPASPDSNVFYFIPA